MDNELYINITGMIEAVEYVKCIKAERDYYRQVVKQHLPLYYIDKDEQINSRTPKDRNPEQ